jgi:hypothetical protein
MYNIFSYMYLLGRYRKAYIRGGQTYDSTNTEEQNCIDNEWNKIYNCDMKSRGNKLKTYNEWQKIGYRVDEGEKAISYNIEGMALFFRRPSS